MRRQRMSIEHTVLVVTQDNDPQLSMLKDLRHIVGRKPDDFAGAVNVLWSSLPGRGHGRCCAMFFTYAKTFAGFIRAPQD